MIWAQVLRRFWPFVAGAVVLVLAWLWHVKKIDEAEDRGYLRAQTEFAHELQKEREHQREVNDEIDREYYAELSTLQRRVQRLLARSDAIRVCEPASELHTSGSTGGTEEASAGSGPTYRPGPDIRPRLVEYGARCEELRRQVIGWQHWYESLR